MKRTTARRGWRIAVMAGTAVLAMGLTHSGVNAEPQAAPAPAPVTEQQLADYIQQGLKDPAAHPITDDSGSAGSSGSACTSGSGAGSGNGSGDCYGGSGSSSGSSGGHSSDTVGYGPQMSAFLPAFGYSLLNPDVGPPGTNDWNCKSDRPPVVLVHGTWVNAYNSFAYMSQPLKDAGFCLFTFNYGRSNLLEGGGLGSVLPGVSATGYVQESAKQLSTFVDRVLTSTGAPKVDLIGYSLGGAMSNWYLKKEGGAAKVGKLVTYGATHHGTSLDGIGALGRAINNFGIDVLGLIEIFVGHAGIQQTIGSDFINELNAGGDTAPGVDYTVVGSRYDEVTNPYDLTFLKAGPGATVHNITLQDGCEQDLSDHLTMMYSPRALSIALNALDPGANPNLQCTFNPWVIGGGGKL
ncbi:triacylglycerol esterase/lipase EstA (alpha/beta hydrolase family) [Nocardia transvalensis]|uniref:Triacylglycerol esterase/lipase EstA (Alpha/beta hydrolase family) n=1 Tax=Nocardia transvalensis TaxID=37333 RepID=A0A7W9PFG6_9NOCA|nr:alpha/beta fold hydrolase [Nocardia transvalensis]MBB5915172.1 triacylglycerol esterase/lipase EstA (alpha/beta hydrolase family) [Nocardia transvalensis]